MWDVHVLKEVIGGSRLDLTATSTSIAEWWSRCWSSIQVSFGEPHSLTILTFITLIATLGTIALAIFFYCLERYIRHFRQNRRVARSLGNFYHSRLYEDAWGPNTSGSDRR